MTTEHLNRKPVTDWLTIIAIAALAASLTGAFHEGVHALSCVIAGGDLQEYSALHVAHANLTAGQGKIVAASASIANLIAGLLFLILVRRSPGKSAEMQFFVWLMMLMNLLKGAGYWMFSGISNVGDWAVVIGGWEPHWLWRTIMAIFGAAAFMASVWLALRELGKIIGGEADEQIGRATKLGLLSYGASIFVVVLAGINNPYGITSLPVIAGFLAVSGALSPLLWMMQWFRAGIFNKSQTQPLEINRQWTWVATGLIIVFGYSFLLGRTVYF